MIAVDTNILVYAVRADSHWHASAADAIKTLAEGRDPWAIPWPCVYEFLAITTNPRIYQPPGELSQALAHLAAWLESPSLVMLAEEAGYFGVFEETVRLAGVVGGAVHDARIAALCLLHGVATLYSADRDFSRYPRLRTVNPLLR